MKFLTLWDADRGAVGYVQPQVGQVNAYLYNGKELNADFGLGWSDYGARWYDGSIGRWNGVDALAEEYIKISSYAFTANNPMKHLEVDGRYFIGVDGERVTYTIEDGVIQLSSNASGDLQKLASSLSKSGLEYYAMGSTQKTVYFEQFEKLANNKSKINFEIKKRGNGSNYGIHLAHDKNGRKLKWKGSGDGMGRYKNGVPSVLKDKETGKLYFEEVTITLYEKPISIVFLDNIRRWKRAPYESYDGYSIIFTHEAEHHLDQEGIKAILDRTQGKENSYNIEDAPYMKENKAFYQIRQNMHKRKK